MDHLPAAIDIAAEVSASTDSIVRPRELLAAGIKRGILDRLIAIRHLRQVLHGLYLVGAAMLSQRQLHRVTLMRAGSRGCLTAHSGLELQRVLWARPGLGTGLTANPRAVGSYRTLVPMETGRPGLIQLERLQDEIVVEVVNGLDVAPMGRLLTDLVAFGGGGLLNIAWREAEFRGRLVREELEADVGTGRRDGGPPVKALVAQRRIVTEPGSDVRGKTEVPWLHLMLEAGIPMPQLNAPVLMADGRTCYSDYLWVLYGLGLELDTPDHLTPVVAARDRARDDDFDEVGIHTLRLIDTIALADPKPSLARVKGALRRRGWAGA